MIISISILRTGTNTVRHSGATTNNIRIIRMLCTSGHNPDYFRGKWRAEAYTFPSKESEAIDGVHIYDTRKRGHNLPRNTTCPDFETLREIPSGIFRITAGEIVGPGAGKCCPYKNPEYYSYKHMVFYDIHLYMRKYRFPSPNLKRKVP